MAMRQPKKIVPVKRASQAFAVQHGVVTHRIRHPPVGIDIGEIEFPARLEQAMHFAQYRILVGRKVNHAVRHDDIETI